MKKNFSLFSRIILLRLIVSDFNFIVLKYALIVLVKTQTMKKILILGAARSGKSTLANMMAEKSGCSIISVDAFISAFQENYPETGIRHFRGNNHVIAPFIASYVNALSYNHPELNFVVEGSQINLDDAIELFSAKLDIIVLGYPRLTAQEVVSNVRKYQKPFDYTVALSDKELFDIASRHIEYSQFLEKECKKSNLAFYDTSNHRDEILNKIIRNLT